MKRRILLPTDFSVNALQASNYALELYKDEACIFYLLNGFYIDINDPDNIINVEPDGDLYKISKLKSMRGLDKLLNALAFGENENSKHSFQTIATSSLPLEAIQKVVEEKNIELIVMGTRGETNSDSKIYGSTAISVMENIRNCPVIVVPQLAKLNLPKEIVFPTSYKTHFKRHELNYLIDISLRCDAAIRVLHVMAKDNMSDKQMATKTQLQDFFSHINHSFHFLKNRSVIAAINCFVDSRESDMLAFLNKKHNFLASIINQPVVKGMAYDSKVPILVMHDQ